MGGQTWLNWILAIVMIALAVYCLSRLLVSWRQHRPTDYHVDALHVLMGVAMAGMLVPSLRVFYIGGWEIVFAIATVYFGWLAFREYRGESTLGGRPGHHLPHVIGSAAMVYMFAAADRMASGSGGSGMSGMAAGSVAHFPTLALVFALAMFVIVIWTTDRLTSVAPVSVLTRQAPAAAPVLTRAGGGDATAPAAGTAARAAAVDTGGMAGAAGRAGLGVPLSPRLSACCEIAMGITMGYMLVLML